MFTNSAVSLPVHWQSVLACITLQDLSMNSAARLANRIKNVAPAKLFLCVTELSGLPAHHLHLASDLHAKLSFVPSCSQVLIDLVYLSLSQALVESMKNVGLEPDTQFFNMLIKRRNFRRDGKAAEVGAPPL